MAASETTPLTQLVGTCTQQNLLFVGAPGSGRTNTQMLWLEHTLKNLPPGSKAILFTNTLLLHNQTYERFIKSHEKTLITVETLQELEDTTRELTNEGLEELFVCIPHFFHLDTEPTKSLMERLQNLAPLVWLNLGITHYDTTAEHEIISHAVTRIRTIRTQRNWEAATDNNVVEVPHLDRDYPDPHYLVGNYLTKDFKTNTGPCYLRLNQHHYILGGYLTGKAGMQQHWVEAALRRAEAHPEEHIKVILVRGDGHGMKKLARSPHLIELNCLTEVAQVIREELESGSRRFYVCATHQHFSHQKNLEALEAVKRAAPEVYLNLNSRVGLVGGDGFNFSTGEHGQVVGLLDDCRVFGCTMVESPGLLWGWGKRSFFIARPIPYDTLEAGGVYRIASEGTPIKVREIEKDRINKWQNQ